MAGATDDLEEAPARRAIERNFRAVDEAEAIAEAKGATIAQVSLAWLLATEGVTAPIVGPVRSSSSRTCWARSTCRSRG